MDQLGAGAPAVSRPTHASNGEDHLKEDQSQFDLHFALVVDAELFRLDSLVRWLDTADGLTEAGNCGQTCADIPVVARRRGAGGAPE